MMSSSVFSKNGVSVRLTDERWTHITEEHCEMAGLRADVLETISTPDWIYEGNEGALFAVRKLTPVKFIAVIYKETAKDGFIITAFMTKKIRSFMRRKQIWPI